LAEIHGSGAAAAAEDTGAPVAREGEHGETSSIDAVVVQEEVIGL